YRRSHRRARRGVWTGASGPGIARTTRRAIADRAVGVLPEGLSHALRRVLFMADQGVEERDDLVEDPAVRVRRLDVRSGTLAALIHSLQAEMVQCLAEFDGANGWQSHDFRSYAQWVSIRTKFPVAEARRLTSLAERLDRVPSLVGDARAGRVSIGMLAAAARVSTPGNEARVAAIVRECTPSQAQRVLSKYRDLAPTYGP